MRVVSERSLAAFDDGTGVRVKELEEKRDPADIFAAMSGNGEPAFVTRHDRICGTVNHYVFRMPGIFSDGSRVSHFDPGRPDFQRQHPR